MCRNSRKLLIILTTFLLVLLYLNFKFVVQNDVSVNDVSSMPLVNTKHKDLPPVTTMIMATKKLPCDEISKLYWKFAKLNNLSDYDMNCILEHYNISGIHHLDKASKLSFLKCNPDYTRFGHKGKFRQYMHVKPTNLGKCTKLNDMRFINGFRVITLVSFPGSGNTWTRLLLEQATGVFTGSIYCDQDLRSSGFYGEQITSSNVLVVKTHYPGIGNPRLNHFNPVNVDGVLFIMRNPLDSIVAERKRQVLRTNKHTGDVGPEFFGMF